MPLVGNHFLGEAQIERLRPRVSFRLASIWQISRKDGVFIRLATTDKDVYFRGYRFLASGPSSSDLEQGEAVAESDFEITGMLDHENILETDLYDGKYDKAKIDQWVVDLDRPWIWFRHHKWWIKQTTVWNGSFKADIVGVEKFLTIPIGRRYEKDCDKVLESLECGATSVSFTGTIASVPSTAGGTILSSTRDTAAMTITQGGGFPTVAATGSDPIWSFGSVTFNDGPNTGIVKQIGFAAIDGTTMSIALAHESPFNFRVGDSITVVGGCDGTKSTCESVFENKVNFGGQPDMPDTSIMYESPEQADATSFDQA